MITIVLFGNEEYCTTVYTMEYDSAYEVIEAVSKTKRKAFAYSSTTEGIRILSGKLNEENYKLYKALDN